MPKTVNKAIPPGAGPFTRGYWAFVWGEPRELPDDFNYSADFRREFERGYDEARHKAQERNSITRG